MPATCTGGSTEMCIRQAAVLLVILTSAYNSLLPQLLAHVSHPLTVSDFVKWIPLQKATWTVFLTISCSKDTISLSCSIPHLILGFRKACSSFCQKSGFILISSSNLLCNAYLRMLKRGTVSAHNKSNYNRTNWSPLHQCESQRHCSVCLK